ncbi:uncharacterized protein [Phyllobates terribilis]|uniref:uncharacterized protein n=1 Tax=Phyllobates terribilis TaxID=111132 RepID=UPI003CCA791E
MSIPEDARKSNASIDAAAKLQAEVLANSIVLPMALQTAIELGLLDIIADAGSDASLTAAEMAEKLSAEGNPKATEMVERILRLLVTFSVVSCSIIGGVTRKVYGLTLVGRYLVKNDDGFSLAPLLRLVTDKSLLRSWYKLKDSVLDGGIAFNKCYGMNAFEYPAFDPNYNELFNATMLNCTSMIMSKILHSYKGFKDINQLVDVGGGLGNTLNSILTMYPEMKAINFDLPHVIKNAIPHPRIQFIGGDMFEGVPKSEAIFMKWVLHDWSNEYCLKLLNNCYKAIPKDGKVIVVESILAEVPETSDEAKVICMSDLTMMTQNPGGKERTKAEFIGLAKAAGFGGIKFECHICHLWVMEFYK